MRLRRKVWDCCERCGGCGGSFGAYYVEGGCAACEGRGAVLIAHAARSWLLAGVAGWALVAAVVAAAVRVAS